MGYRVSRLSAGGPGNEDDTGPKFDHRTLLIDFEFPWLADVGFGECFLEPLPLMEDVESLQRDTLYGVDRQADRWRLLRCAEGDPRGVPAHKPSARDWRMLYDFTLTPRKLAEFEAMARYHQTSPESHFTRGRVCSRLTPTGRITLTQRSLLVADGPARSEAMLKSDADYERALGEHFGLTFARPDLSPVQP